MKPSRAQVVVGILLAALGFAAVTQVRSNEADATYAGYREQDLIDLLNGLAGASERAQTEIAELEQTQRDLQSNTRDRQAALEVAQEQADRLAILAGTVAVTGPGIRITIEDPDLEVDISDLLDGIQELRTGGAEAIEFNDEVRVIAQSSFEEASGGVLIKSGGDDPGRFIAPPYVIDVIGEPHELAEALVFPQGLRDTVQEAGGDLVTEELDPVTIDSVVQLAPSDFAQP